MAWEWALKESTVKQARMITSNVFKRLILKVIPHKNVCPALIFCIKFLLTCPLYLYIMAYPSIELIEGLRKAAGGLRNGAYYAWGHHGACNCGHLLQATTQLSKEDILTYAHTSLGEWTEIAEESCAITGAPVMLLLKKLEGLGLTPTDINHLEYLDDRDVLQHLPGGFRWLKRNVREDVIAYFETMAMMLGEKLVEVDLSKLLQVAEFA
jgi:hypothetical protein